MAKIDKKDIKKAVSDLYGSVADGREGIKVDSEDLGKALGYSREELDLVPAEANLGLGCGNPFEYGKPLLGEVVLDLGCGKGMDVFIAAKKVGGTGHVIGVDMTPKMIETARKISEGRGFTNVEFRLGEIEHLPLADNSVDLVISNCVINLSIDKAQVYREILRVLKPGGRISVSDIVHIQDLPDSVLENPAMYGTCVAGGMKVGEKKELLEDLGFKNVEIYVEKVSDEYASKWGIKEIDLRQYIARSATVAYKE